MNPITKSSDFSCLNEGAWNFFTREVYNNKKSLDYDSHSVLILYCGFLSRDSIYLAEQWLPIKSDQKKEFLVVIMPDGTFTNDAGILRQEDGKPERIPSALLHFVSGMSAGEEIVIVGGGDTVQHTEEETQRIFVIQMEKEITKDDILCSSGYLLFGGHKGMEIQQCLAREPISNNFLEAWGHYGSKVAQQEKSSAVKVMKSGRSLLTSATLMTRLCEGMKALSVDEPLPESDLVPTSFSVVGLLGQSLTLQEGFTVDW